MHTVIVRFFIILYTCSLLNLYVFLSAINIEIIVINIKCPFVNNPYVKERLVEEARESSYSKAEKKASYGTEISKQTVKNIINELEFKPEIKENNKEKNEQKRKLRELLRKLKFEEFKEKSYEILAEEMEEKTRKRKEKLMEYIYNNKEGIMNLYSKNNQLHGCSAESHISHIYSDRMSSRPMGWSTEKLII